MTSFSAWPKGRCEEINEAGNDITISISLKAQLEKK